MEFLSVPWWSALLTIVLIDLVLAGDNAVVIALACRGLPPKQQKWGVALGAGAAVLLRVIFTIFIAYLLMFFFAIKNRWFYSLSTVSDATPFIEHVYRATLPAVTLTLVIVAHMMRMTRAAIINLLASPYIEMAQLKGVQPRDVIVRHALPNAWAPIATVIAFNLAYLVVGVVVVEVATRAAPLRPHGSFASPSALSPSGRSIANTRCARASRPRAHTRGRSSPSRRRTRPRPAQKPDQPPALRGLPGT